MVLKVPHFNNDPIRVCFIPYGLLGFGDILVPGLLLSYCHSFDLLCGYRYKLYWVITCIAYILGLVVTFISLFLMNAAQPALLYLVPFTLLPTILVAAIKGDLSNMWAGDFKTAGGVVRRSVMTESPTRRRSLEADQGESDDKLQNTDREFLEDNVEDVEAENVVERTSSDIDNAEGMEDADPQHTVRDNKKLINNK
jgi:hypothetical protein